MKQAPRTPFALSEAERRRAEQVDRLAALGAEGVPELLEMLTDPSWTVRRGVVASLAALGDAAVGPLCEALRARRDNEARIAAAVDALSASTGDADPAVLALSMEEDPAVVADAAQILGRRKSARAIPRLGELAEQRDENVAVAAIEALGRIGGRMAVDSLVRAVQSGSFFRTFPAIDVLARSSDLRAVAPLADLLDDPRYVLEAARALGRIGDRSAAAPLVRLFSRPGETIVRVAATALAELRERYAERYGVVEPVDEALRRAAPMPATLRRLCQSLSGADSSEQAAIAAVLGALGSDEAVSDLTRLLSGPQAVASVAADAIAQLGRSSDARVIQALRGGDSARRLLLLPLVTGDAAEAEVIACLGDPDPLVRAVACDALGRIGDPRATRALFPLLGDPGARVVHAAVTAIQTLGSAETEALATAAAHSPNPGTRRTALQILAYFGYPSALPIFLGARGDPDERVRERAIQGLPFLDDPRALDALLEGARDPSPKTRAQVARALGQCTALPRVTQCLREGLGDPDAWVRYYSCQSLGKLRAAEASELVAALLDDQAGHVRVAAVEALSAMGGEVALEALRRAVHEQDEDIRRAALIGLGLARRSESLPTLLDAGLSPDAATRLVAISAIAAFSSDEVLSALARAARDPDESVSAAAIGILAERPGVEATRALVNLLREPPLRPRVSSALSTPVEGRLKGLSESLVSADDELAVELCSALARMRRDAATEALLSALRLPSVPARKAAATTLAAIGTWDAFAALEQAAATDPDPEVQRICSLVVRQWVA